MNVIRSAVPASCQVLKLVFYPPIETGRQRPYPQEFAGTNREKNWGAALNFIKQKL